MFNVLASIGESVNMAAILFSAKHDQKHCDPSLARIKPDEITLGDAAYDT